MAFFLPKKDPAYEALHLASAEKRLYAVAIDFLVLYFLLTLFQQTKLLLFAEIIYFIACWWKLKGKTLGNKIMKIRVVTDERKPLSFRQACLRMLGFVLCEIALFIGFFGLLFDKKKQGWHDKLARTIVIYENA